MYHNWLFYVLLHLIYSIFDAMHSWKDMRWSLSNNLHQSFMCHMQAEFLLIRQEKNYHLVKLQSRHPLAFLDFHHLQLDLQPPPSSLDHLEISRLILMTSLLLLDLDKHWPHSNQNQSCSKLYTYHWSCQLQHVPLNQKLMQMSIRTESHFISVIG